MRIILSICLFAAASAFAAETNFTLTVDGITYTNAHFGATTPSSVTLFHSTGVATIPLEKLPPDLQKQLGYDPQRVAQQEAAAAEAQKKAADARRVRIKVSVDGSGTVKLRDGKLWYEVNSFGPPDKPITVNGVEWTPVWKEGVSDVYDSFAPPLTTLKGATVNLKRISGRGRVKIIDQPNPDNNYTLAVSLDDSLEWGADWYEVELSW
jgi:hypothetical protein